MAKRARVALEKVDGVDSVVVDTTARGIIRMKKDKTPTKEALNEAISKLRCKVTSFEKTEIAKPVEAVELSIEGLG